MSYVYWLGLFVILATAPFLWFGIMRAQQGRLIHALAWLCVASGESNSLARGIDASMVALNLWLWWMHGGDDDFRKRRKKLGEKAKALFRQFAPSPIPNPA